MSHNIPLILAGALIPMLRWMRRNGKPVSDLLEEADLQFLPYIDPQQPIPLRNAIRLLGELGAREQADIGLRMVSEHSVHELAFIGRVALGAKTPRESFERIALAIPYHSSHEVFSIRPSQDSLAVIEGWSLSIDDVDLYLIHQYFTGVIHRICAFTQLGEPLLSEVKMLPHPEYGLEHLNMSFARQVKPAPDRLLRITISNAVVDSRYFKVARERHALKDQGQFSNLNFNGSLSASIKAVLGLQLLDGSPSIDRLAVWAGVPRRTLQRRLSDEGTSFSTLLESVRMDMALHSLKSGRESMDEIAAKLGFERQSTFTRAVRRWTGQTPSQVRNR
ncbi:AraC-type DNA-binding protein [Shimia gijangensis]|uniref:AraC-type DNA-binding protein n=1 Tax=Shimia gijangensis TaxID=1470563 RepID=A0A1M6E342_9RHOB|nr:AraC family transcriptional regulator [Shimia gijangensis]SHI79809.1 AraC-type DNA-binding protein [Shimia gijangensis]